MSDVKFKITKDLLNKEFRAGNLLKFLIVDSATHVTAYCNKCSNIANAIVELPVAGGAYKVPVCKTHFEQVFPDYDGGFPVSKQFQIHPLK